MNTATDSHQFHIALKMVEKHATSAADLYSSLHALFIALRDSAPKMSPAALEAFGAARETLARHGSLYD